MFLLLIGCSGIITIALLRAGLPMVGVLGVAALGSLPMLVYLRANLSRAEDG